MISYEINMETFQALLLDVKRWKLNALWEIATALFYLECWKHEVWFAPWVRYSHSSLSISLSLFSLFFIKLSHQVCSKTLSIKHYLALIFLKN